MTPLFVTDAAIRVFFLIVKRLQQIEKRIEKIKEALLKMGPMRPGSLTCQYKDPKEKSGPFWQISYTRAMRSRSDYIRPDCVETVKKEIATCKRFNLKTAVERLNWRR